MADKSNDPVAMWQNMMGEMEKGFNSFANQAMASPEFSKVVNQVGGAGGRRGTTVRRADGEISVGMNLPSRAQMVSMAERLQSIEGQFNEIKALLHQAHKIHSAAAGGYAGAPKPPRTKRPPSAKEESRNERSFRTGPGVDPGPDQSEVQRAIQRSIKGVEYIASSGPALGSTPKDILHVRGTMNLYHYRPLADDLSRPDPDRDGHYQPRLHPRYGTRPELHRVSAEARLRRLHAGLDRAEAGREIAADGGLRARLHSGLRPPRAAGFRRDRRHRDRLLFRRRAVAAVRFDLQRRPDEESDLLHHPDRFPRNEAVPEFFRQALFRRRSADR